MRWGALMCSARSRLARPLIRLSANPPAAAVLATLDIFEGHDILGARRSSAIIEEGLLALKALPFVSHVRGEKDGMVWGVEIDMRGGRTASEIARACVLAAYRGDGDGRAIHIMGPLATRVLRIACRSRSPRPKRARASTC